MTRPSVPRAAMGLGGVLLIGLGVVNLLAFDVVDLLWVFFWLGAGLILHDGVVAPATALAGKFAADRWSPTARRSLVIALVCIGSLTLIAVPLVIQHNAVAGNDTLLGRNYLVGWAIAALLVVVGVGLAEGVGRARAHRRQRQSTDTAWLRRKAP